MRPIPTLLLITAVATLVAGCAREDGETRTAQSYALGTRVELVTWGLDEARAEAAQAEVTRVLTEADRRWDAWGPQGALADVNAAIRSDDRVDVDPALGRVLSRARALGLASEGRFDPTLGRLVELWGFHREAALRDSPPSREAVEAVLPAGGLAERYVVEDGGITITGPAFRFDLGGFAKGLAVGRARDRLRAMGVTDAIINAGGDLCTWGAPGDRPWRIAVRQPRGTGPLASIETAEGECVFSSGDYERYFEADGRRYHHVLDPATGYPVSEVMAVTVVHTDPAIADAAATALMVSGPEDWIETAHALGVDTALLVERSGRVRLTPAMARRIRFEARDVPRIVDGVRESTP